MLETNAPEQELGARFRNAREALGISVGEAAESLHIIPRYVRCMESGDYSQLPGVVFLKGYARAYARLLELPEDRMMALLDSALEGKSYFAETADRFAALPKSSPTHHGKWLVVALLLLAGSAISFWFNRANESGEPPVSPASVENAPTAMAPVKPSPTSESEGDNSGADVNETVGQHIPLTSAPVTAPAPGTDINVSVHDVQTASGDASATAEIPLEVNFAAPEVRNAVTPDVVPENAELAFEQAQHNVAPEVVLQDTGAALTNSEVESPVVEADQASLSTTDAGSVSINVTFSGDCWFDIRDARDERVVQLFRSGQSLTFSGQRPIHVIAGAADAVDIHVDGQPWSLSRYKIWNNRVEFILEP